MNREEAVEFATANNVLLSRPDGVRFLSAINGVTLELSRAVQKHGSMHGPHEGYAVILEELDEVWDIARMKRKNRDEAQLRKELIQVATMAVKAIHSMPNFIGGSV